MKRIFPQLIIDVILRRVDVTPTVRIVQADGGQIICCGGPPINLEHYSSPLFSWPRRCSTYSLESSPPVRSISSPIFATKTLTFSAGMPGLLERKRRKSSSIMALSSSVLISFIGTNLGHRGLLRD